MTHDAPPPNAVRGNDWPALPVADAAAFEPRLGVTVVLSYFEAPGALACALAALDRQDYPRGLLEAVVVDDGSREPLDDPRARIGLPATGVPLHVVRQENRGFGLARARNAGARAARHPILVFLDGDTVAEPGLVRAHARWHHAVADAVTIGFRRWAAVDTDALPGLAARLGDGDGYAELEAATYRDNEPYQERFLARTERLACDRDDLFRAVIGGNFAVSKAFYAAIGGCEEAFVRWGHEDVEFGYRAYAQGAVLVPAEDAWGWHLGRWEEGRAAKRAQRQRQGALTANRIAHRDYRRHAPGHVHSVPMHAVAVVTGDEPAARVAGVVRDVLGDPAGDVAVAVDGAGAPAAVMDRLRDAFGDDPRVRVAPAGTTLDLFPATPLHAALPAGWRHGRGPLSVLLRDLGGAVAATRRLEAGEARIARSWALHRARRTGLPVSAFGAAVRVDGRGGRLRLRRRAVVDGRDPAAPGGAATAAAERPCADRAAATGTAAETPAPVPAGPAPGSEPAAELAPWLLAANPQLAVPPFDPGLWNPVGWTREARRGAATLGPPGLLPVPGRWRAERVAPTDLEALRRARYVEDVAALHADTAARAGALARTAATGAPVYLADGGPGLEALLGEELYELMTTDLRGADEQLRELWSVATRRAALRDHTLAARTRQTDAARGAPDGPAPPTVSVLLATRRPEFLPWAVANVARQSYPALELVLALHGDAHAGVDLDAILAAVAAPVRIVRVAAERPLGSVLNAASAAATGHLLAKMDDDDLYGEHHLWDLVLAREYSGAALVGKRPETAYLLEADRTLRCFLGGGECDSDYLSGGCMLLGRDDLRRAGGWRRLPMGVDPALIADVQCAGGRTYRTHGAGYVMIRRAAGEHTWPAGEEHLKERASARHHGWRPHLAGVDGDLADYPVRRDAA